MSRPFVFLGPPASGKGTQAQRLAESLGFSYLSTGGLLRKALKDGSQLGEEARPFLDRGEYVPDEIMVPMVLDWIDGTAGQWILDGFPRTLPQAEALTDALAQAGKALPLAIVIEVPHEELRKRVGSRLECEACHWTTTTLTQTIEGCPKCGGILAARRDDSAEKFESRLQEFQKLVLPTIAYYREQAQAALVDGVGSPDEVAARLANQIKMTLPK